MMMTDYDALIERARELDANIDDLWTFMDNDPSVAWHDPDSWHGRVAQLYLDAGWEWCHHRDARFHFNIKVRDWYSHYIREVAKVEESRPLLDRDQFDLIAERVQEWERESWWEALDLRFPDFTDERFPGERLFSCGRSGGYLNADALNRHLVPMIELARHCQQSVDYYNGEDWVKYLIEQALERYDEDKLSEMASPRREAERW